MELQTNQSGDQGGEEMVGAPLERRASPRYPYRVMRKIAPLQRGLQGMFQVVNCSDISERGVSFYWQGRPDFDEFVVTLNSGENDIPMMGRVVAQHDMKGTNLVLVQAEFVHCLE